MTRTIGFRFTWSDQMYSRPMRLMPFREFQAYVRKELIRVGFSMLRPIKCQNCGGERFFTQEVE